MKLLHKEISNCEECPCSYYDDEQDTIRCSIREEVLLQFPCDKETEEFLFYNISVRCPLPNIEEINGIKVPNTEL